jgi:hypothetical protein
MKKDGTVRKIRIASMEANMLCLEVDVLTFSFLNASGKLFYLSSAKPQEVRRCLQMTGVSDLAVITRRGTFRFLPQCQKEPGAGIEVHTASRPSKALSYSSTTARVQSLYIHIIVSAEVLIVTGTCDFGKSVGPNFNCRNASLLQMMLLSSSRLLFQAFSLQLVDEPRA